MNAQAPDGPGAFPGLKMSGVVVTGIRCKRMLVSRNQFFVFCQQESGRGQPISRSGQRGKEHTSFGLLILGGGDHIRG